MNPAITTSLHTDHLATLSLLERLEDDLSRRGVSDMPAFEDLAFQDLLSELVLLLESEVKEHFAFEEEHLFPLFAQHINPGIPQMLKEEHDIIRPLAEVTVLRARTALKHGFDGELWKVFHDDSLELIEREIFHIQKEEMGFLPNLGLFIKSSEDGELSATYAELKERACPEITN